MVTKVIWFQFHSGSIKSHTPTAFALINISFNSIVVRLKVCHSEREDNMQLKSFNSIVVRLKDLRQVSKGDAIAEFQFHSGSIKRIVEQVDAVEHVLFQFHSGSIKSYANERVEIAIFAFQFHSGSIKSVIPVSYTAYDTGFNSIVVRLKVSPTGIVYFDSTRFQFHSGSIKRKRRWCGRTSQSWFQFHSGSIKSKSHSLRSAVMWSVSIP